MAYYGSLERTVVWKDTGDRRGIYDLRGEIDLRTSSMRCKSRTKDLSGFSAVFSLFCI